ncbi:MAG: hypothetical protein HY718_02525, partial [Planctomycetes bacterium]|nr:hypothetical protein [Planctomycetota bacterium]
LRGGGWESEVRVLNEVPDPQAPSEAYRHADLGPFGTVADRTWPKTIATLHTDTVNGAQDASVIKSLCFSNSPVPGQNTPAGARLFGVYDVRSLDEPSPDGQDNDWSYYSVGFQIVELNAAGKRIRVMQVGLAASMFYDNPDPAMNNHSPDLLVAPWAADLDGGARTRHNTSGCRVGTIRYNKAKNTLCVAANIGEWDNYWVCVPPVGRVYEFELPDWPEVYYESGPYVGQPMPQSDPNLVKLVQVYEMPSRCETAEGTRYDVNRCECLLDLQGTWYGHSISQGNGGIGRNEGQRAAIALDDAGNLYFTSRFFNATSGPIWNGTVWVGEGLWWGDVVKCSTLGHYAGREKYVVPVTGADAGNLVISAEIESALVAGYPPNAAYDGGPGVAMRGNQLLQMAQITCNDLNAQPYFVYVNLFDPSSTVGGAYPYELVRIKSLSNHRCDIPRKPNYAQTDEVSGKTFLGNGMGACDCAQNFIYVDGDAPTDTVRHDVGYFLTVTNPNGSSPGNMTHTWDAASPPGAPPDSIGACCLAGHGCEQKSLTECTAAGGFWQGWGTTCGQFPCPEGACYRPCTPCQQALASECASLGGVWNGLGSVCGQNAPKVCAQPPMDEDCDGDVDMKDFAALQRCITTATPGPVTLPEECRCFDVNDDQQVGSLDLDAFIGCGSGESVPAAPGCY